MPTVPVFGSAVVGSSLQNACPPSAVMAALQMIWVLAEANTGEFWMVPTAVKEVVDIEAFTSVVVATIASGLSGSRLIMVQTNTSLSKGDRFKETCWVVKVFAADSTTAVDMVTVSDVLFKAMSCMPMPPTYLLIGRPRPPHPLLLSHY